MQAYPPYIFLGSEIKRAFFSMKFFLVGGSKNTIYDICITKYVQM